MCLQTLVNAHRKRNILMPAWQHANPSKLMLSIRECYQQGKIMDDSRSTDGRPWRVWAISTFARRVPIACLKLCSHWAHGKLKPMALLTYPQAWSLRNCVPWYLRNCGPSETMGAVRPYAKLGIGAGGPWGKSGSKPWGPIDR